MLPSAGMHVLHWIKKKHVIHLGLNTINGWQYYCSPYSILLPETR